MLRRRVVGVLFLVTLAVTGAIGFKAFVRRYTITKRNSNFTPNQFEKYSVRGGRKD
ncbi:MAG: hypothetical protein ACLRTA_00445 [Clostridia bacterium]